MGPPPVTPERELGFLPLPTCSLFSPRPPEGASCLSRAHSPPVAPVYRGPRGPVPCVPARSGPPHFMSLLPAPPSHPDLCSSGMTLSLGPQPLITPARSPAYPSSRTPPAPLPEPEPPRAPLFLSPLLPSPSEFIWLPSLVSHLFLLVGLEIPPGQIRAVDASRSPHRHRAWHSA